MEAPTILNHHMPKHAISRRLSAVAMDMKMQNAKSVAAYLVHREDWLLLCEDSMCYTDWNSVEPKTREFVTNLPVFIDDLGAFGVKRGQVLPLEIDNG